MKTWNSYTRATKTVQLRRSETDDEQEWHNIGRYDNPQKDSNYRRWSEVAVQELFP